MRQRTDGDPLDARLGRLANILDGYSVIRVLLSSRSNLRIIGGHEGGVSLGRGGFIASLLGNGVFEHNCQQVIGGELPEYADLLADTIEIADVETGETLCRYRVVRNRWGVSGPYVILTAKSIGKSP